MQRHEFLRALFAFARAKGLGLSLARPYGMELAGLSGDLDLVAEARDVSVFLDWIRSQEGLAVTARYRRPDGESVFVHGLLSPRCGGTAVDFISELSCKGIPYLSVHEALLRAEEKEGVFCLSPVDEALVLLMTLAARHKAPARPDYVRALRDTLRDHDTALTERLVAVLGDAIALETAEALRGEDFSQDHARRVLKAYLRQGFLRDDALSALARRLNYYSARLLQIFFTPHSVICFYGIDGAGKTTLIDALRDDFGAMTHRVVYGHFRPLLPMQKEPDSGRALHNPQGMPPRDAFSSMLKAVFYMAWHWVARLWPHPVDRLTVYDRGMWDFYVDPLRFRYGGPMGFLRLICRLAPSAMVSVFVDVSPETAQKRKREVTLDESRRQAEAYRLLAAHLPNALIVRGDLPIETLRRTVREFVLRRLRERAL